MNTRATVFTHRNRLRQGYQNQQNNKQSTYQTSFTHFMSYAVH